MFCLSFTIYISELSLNEMEIQKIRVVRFPQQQKVQKILGDKETFRTCAIEMPDGRGVE